MNNSAAILLTVSMAPLLAAVEAFGGAGASSAIIQDASIGAVLAWFMWRNERRMTRLEESWDRHEKVRLLTSLQSAPLPPPLKAEAENLLAEIERKQ
jgi:hypothetical protein